jgi:hypothetical protein
MFAKTKSLVCCGARNCPANKFANLFVEKQTYAELNDHIDSAIGLLNCI